MAEDVQSSFFDRVACETCGPVQPPDIHRLCHSYRPGPRVGCGHLLADHTADEGDCRICGRACGLDSWRDPVARYLRPSREL